MHKIISTAFARNKRYNLNSLFGIIAISMTMASCSSNDELNFSGVDPALTVPPTQIMVLGTTHLSNYHEGIALDDLDPIIDRLAAYAPDVITIENSSGMTCNRARTYPLEHVGYADVYCLDGTAFRKESGLTQAEGSFKARRALRDWPDEPSAAQRRSLAAAFIASEELHSALVQWYRLDNADRVAGDGLGPNSVELLITASQALGEGNSIAARLAARLGLERVFYADDHGSYLDLEGEGEAHFARLKELWWLAEDDPCRTRSKSAETKLLGGDILGAYREYNSVNAQRTAMNCDIKRAMNDAEQEAYGRQYTMSWQARNLRMTALIMAAATTEPGGRVLSIVGATHKPYFEAYLDQMHDVEIIDTGTVLD